MKIIEVEWDDVTRDESKDNLIYIYISLTETDDADLKVDNLNVINSSTYKPT